MKKLDFLYLIIALIASFISSIAVYFLVKNSRIIFSVLYFLFFLGGAICLFQIKTAKMRFSVIGLLSVFPAVIAAIFIKNDLNVGEIYFCSYSFSFICFIVLNCVFSVVKKEIKLEFSFRKAVLGNRSKIREKKKMSKKEILAVIKDNLVIMLIIFIIQIIAAAVLGYLYAEFRWHQYIKELFSSWSIDISFFNYYLCCCHCELPVAMVLILILTRKNLLGKLFSACRYFLYICCFFVCFIFFAFRGTESLCFWNPLIDTNHSKTFNINNVPKVKEGMTREEITALIGGPLEQEKNYSRYTEDGGTLTGDFAWYKLVIVFEDDIAVKIDSDIICD
ncbi:MAG: hypothetical protein MJ159_01580 [Treponemataceae bacterium]|nr:hypothetical protein [Treponemataceae bacterium]